MQAADGSGSVLRLFFGTGLVFLCAATCESSAGSSPNFLIILADDMGYSDLGCYGGEINTPNLDALAKGGLRYSQFYNTARCWPTRAALLTGYYAQQVNRDALPRQTRKKGRIRPAWSQLLPELLAPLGYRSYHSGKWHLDGQPMQSGFLHSYQLEDHNRFFTAKQHLLDGQPLPEQSKADKYYATDAIADYAIEFLQEHERTSPNQPFFHYVAFTAPHFPLQAPAEDIERYADKYRVGWDEVRAARWQRIQQLHELPGTMSKLEPQIGTPYTHHFEAAKEILGPGELNAEVPWNALTDRQKDFQAAKMAIHAAMIDNMDQNVGRILKQLRQSGDLENTVIFVLSDNGASAEIMVRGDGHDPDASPGSAASYLCLGAGWSSAANTPFRRHKTWVHEGGISTPLIVHWPAGIQPSNEWRTASGHVIDLAPTILGLAGGIWPTNHKNHPVPSTPGRDFSSTFASDQPLDRESLWWLHEGNRALRSDGWKLVAAKNQPWELYNLEQDRAEMTNLAIEFPNRVKQLSKLWHDHTEEFVRQRDSTD